MISSCWYRGSIYISITDHRHRCMGICSIIFYACNCMSISIFSMDWDSCYRCNITNIY